MGARNLRICRWRFRILLSCAFLVGVHGSEEAIAVPRNGFHIARALRRIRKGRAQLRHRFIQAAIEIDKRLRGPELFADLFARDYLARMFQEERKYLEGLLLQLDSNASFAQLRSPQVHFENAEAARLRATFDALHTHHTPFFAGKA